MTPVTPLMPLMPVRLFGSGSTVLAAILYSSPFTYTLDANGNTLATNKGSFDDAEVFSGSGVELQANNELPVPIPNNGGANSFITLVNGDGTVEQIDNSLNAPSTTYDLINQTVLEAMPTTKELTTADLALIEADTSLMTRLSLGATDTGLSLVTADVYKHFSFSEYSGADCIDTKDGTTATISNYPVDDTVRTNIDFNPKGNQGVEFERDGAGVPYEWKSDRLNWHGDGDVDTNLIPNGDVYSIIEEISGELQNFGSEEIDDVDFNGTGSWSSNATITVSGGVASFVNTPLGNALYNPHLSIESGATFLITVEVSSYSSGRATIELPNTSYNIDIPQAVGVYQLEVQSSTTSVLYITAREADTTLDIASFSMKQLTTKTQRTRTNTLTHSNVDGDNFYIDTVLQDVTPPLPSTTETIVLSETPVIGYADTIDATIEFEYVKEIKVP